MDRESRKRRRPGSRLVPVIALQRDQHQQQMDADQRDDQEEESDPEDPGAGTEEDEEDEEEDEYEPDQQRQQLLVPGHNQLSLQCPGSSVKIVKVVPLPHARSEVWSYFGFIADDDGEIQDRKKAICKICATTLSYSGNTTNMFTHLKAMHPEARPQKLQPTNKFPRTGRKAPSKRKFLEAIANTGHLAIRYEPGDANGNRHGFNAGSSQPQVPAPNSYIIRVHSTSNGTEQVFEETLSVSPDIDHAAASTGNTSAIHHHRNDTPVVPAATMVTASPSVICVNKNLLTSASSASAGGRGGSCPQEIGSVSVQQQHHQQSNHNHHHIHEQEDEPGSWVSHRTEGEITGALVDMIVKDCRPLCLVQGRGFQSLLKLIAPAYQVPDHQRLQSLVRSKYDDLRRELILKGMAGGGGEEEEEV